MVFNSVVRHQEIRGVKCDTSDKSWLCCHWLGSHSVSGIAAIILSQNHVNLRYALCIY